MLNCIVLYCKSIAWKCCFLKCVFSLAALRASLDKMLWQFRLCGLSEFEAHSTKPNYLVSARLRSSSFIHSDHFYSASSSPLLLRGSPDTALILCRSSTLKSHRQLRVKNLPKVPMWQPERDSNPRPSG